MRVQSKVKGLETSEEVMMAHQRPKCSGMTHEGTSEGGSSGDDWGSHGGTTTSKMQGVGAKEGVLGATLQVIHDLLLQTQVSRIDQP